jgi:acyl carrier protein
MVSEPVTPEDIRAAVIALVARITERRPEEVSATAHFVDDLGIDSLMAMEMMVAVNKKYRIALLDEEFRAIQNVDDAVAAVQRHLAAARGPTP